MRSSTVAFLVDRFHAMTDKVNGMDGRFPH